MGVPATGSVSREKFLHQHFPLGGHARSSGTVPETAPCPGPRASAVFARTERLYLRYPFGGAFENREARRAAPDYADEFPKSLLEHCAATRASHRERLQPSARRSARQRHDQRPDGRITQLPVGADLARSEPADPARWCKQKIAC